MAEGQRVVGVKWEVDTKQLSLADQLARQYTTTLKKMNQVHGEVAKAADILAQSYVQSTQAAAKQKEITENAAEALYLQLDAIRQSNAAIMESLSSVDQNSQAQEKNTESTKKNTEAKKEQTRVLGLTGDQFLKGARTLAFWTIGAASTYRLIQKLRREFIETVKALTEQTEGYKNLAESTNAVKAALLSVIGNQETWSQGLDLLGNQIKAFGYGLAQTVATVRGLGAGLIQVYQNALIPFGEAVLEVTKRVTDNEEVIDLLTRAVGFLGEEMSVLDAITQEHDRTMRNYFETYTKLTKAKEPLTGALGKGEEWEKRREQIDRYNDYMEALIDAEERRIEELIDLWHDYQQRLEDIGTDVQRAMDDLTLKGARRREDIETDYQRRLQDIETNAQDNRAKAEERYRIRLIKIEMRYREQLIRIEENFQDAMYDAISARDATAALKAIRTRERETNRARRQRDDAREEARLDYQTQINDQERALQRMREDAEKARQRALEDLKRDMERERQDILLDQQRKLDDLGLYWDRRRADIESEYNDEVMRARAQYKQDEREYRQHLRNKLAELQSYYLQAVKLYKTYAGYLSVPLQAPGSKTQSQGSTGHIYSQVSGAQGMAGVTTGPTNITAGERVPEVYVVQPLMPSSYTFSGSMRHSVSGQIEAIMPMLEGRLSAAVTDQVLRVFQDVLQ
jgi:DNA repair exonuclease SbcCD ATPase subunit